jgi:hypothetical protein
MRRTLTVAAAGTLALALLLGTTGCTRVKLQDLPQTRAETLDKTVALDGATSLRTEIMQGVGELTVTGLETSSTAMTGRFVYAPADWKPEVSYSATGGVGTLAIRQPAHTDVQLFEHSENTWDVRLAKGIPTDLKLTLGVGTSDIDLRGVDLTSLDVVNGVGETKIDLSGARATGFSGSIESGVGKLTLRLPRSVGARVTGGKGGIGEFVADGVRVSSDSWVNDAWSGTGPKIDITLHRGVGEVDILLVD